MRSNLPESFFYPKIFCLWLSLVMVSGWSVPAYAQNSDIPAENGEFCKKNLHDLSSAEYFAELKKLKNKLTIKLTPHSFSVKESANHYFRANVDDGILTFAVYTDTADGRAVYLNAKNLFEQMMLHFKKEGVEIRCIEDDWRGGDNRDVYNQLVSKGAAPEYAALETWTGLQAKKYGFTDVYFDDEETVYGIDGKTIKRLVVNFYRPSAK